MQTRRSTCKWKRKQTIIGIWLYYPSLTAMTSWCWKLLLFASLGYVACLNCFVIGKSGNHFFLLLHLCAESHAARWIKWMFVTQEVPLIFVAGLVGKHLKLFVHFAGWKCDCKVCYEVRWWYICESGQSARGGEGCSSRPWIVHGQHEWVSQAPSLREVGCNIWGIRLVGVILQLVSLHLVFSTCQILLCSDMQFGTQNMGSLLKTKLQRLSWNWYFQPWN